MKKRTEDIWKSYCQRYGFIKKLEEPIIESMSMLLDCFQKEHKLLVCGNGGSNADADHIVGELLKGFLLNRAVDETFMAKMRCYGESGAYLAKSLQGSLPAINLGAHTSLVTAVLNDVSGDVIFAQQVFGYGKDGDVFLGISTSGNSKDVLYAGIVAKEKGLKTLALTGESGGEMEVVFDRAIRVPSNCTPDIQDMHTAVYHVLCAMVESEMFL